jgi:RNA polymerase sigma-70 factor (ECF subfamily)
MDDPVATMTSFDSFYAAHRSRLISTLDAAERCGADAATDAVDEAFVRALAHWRRVERMDGPAGWVFTVARNHLRRTRSRRITEQDLLARSRPNGVDAGTHPSWELWDAVAALPERERLAIALRYIGDMTEREVAAVMRIAPGTVAAMLHAARQHLARALAERPQDARPTPEVTHDV